MSTIRPWLAATWVLPLRDGNNTGGITRRLIGGRLEKSAWF
jgi:hypothetical protein